MAEAPLSTKYVGGRWVPNPQKAGWETKEYFLHPRLVDWFKEHSMEVPRLVYTPFLKNWGSNKIAILVFDNEEHAMMFKLMWDEPDFSITNV